MAAKHSCIKDTMFFGIVRWRAIKALKCYFSLDWEYCQIKPGKKTLPKNCFNVNAFTLGASAVVMAADFSPR